MLCQDPLENLNTWSYNTNKLMDLVMKTTHLINKEEMVSWSEKFWKLRFLILVNIFQVHKTLGAGAVAATE